MIVEEALATLEIILNQEPLNEIQKIVFCQVWEQKTYFEIAESTGYDEGYVKYVGFQLWKLLSAALGEKITKSNMRSVLEQHIFKRKTGILFEKSSFQSRENCSEAINVLVFYGLTEELVTLKYWLDKKDCRLVALLGIGRIEEITPSIELIKQIQKQFDYVIWRSLYKSDSIESLLQVIIQTLFNQIKQRDLYNNCGEHLFHLFQFLQKYRILFIFDNLDEISCDQNEYKQYSQNYGNSSLGYAFEISRFGKVRLKDN